MIALRDGIRPTVVYPTLRARYVSTGDQRATLRTLFAIPRSVKDSGIRSLQDDFAGLKECFERDLKATVPVNMPGMDRPHGVQHLCHMNVIIFERDHEQRISIGPAAGPGYSPGLTTASHAGNHRVALIPMSLNIARISSSSFSPQTMFSIFMIVLLGRNSKR
jgi:hypothetical protein